jgi:hypothetical protein
VDIVLRRNDRISRLGSLGEQLAEEALIAQGFVNVRNLNRHSTNHEYADLLAERGGTRYFIGVKSRNEFQLGGLKRNDSYNFVLAPDALNRWLKSSGKTTEQITELLLSRVRYLADRYDAVPAWITIPIRASECSYAVYFGLVEALGRKRVVPMTPKAMATYECLKGWTRDVRITSNLLNSE